jgi:hypothetical protein
VVSFIFGFEAFIVHPFKCVFFLLNCLGNIVEIWLSLLCIYYHFWKLKILPWRLKLKHCFLQIEDKLHVWIPCSSCSLQRSAVRLSTLVLSTNKSCCLGLKNCSIDFDDILIQMATSLREDEFILYINLFLQRQKSIIS